MSFEFEFEKGHLDEILGRDSEGLYDAMVEMFPKYAIVSIARVAGFLAQCGHESNNFKVRSENLNYSAKALDAIFGKYFARAGRDAEEYHRQPEKIANVIYANRMENGDTDSGDGWRFRGGGFIQLTGRYNYTKFGESVGMSAEEAVDYVRTDAGAIESACWFWSTNNINKYCDDMDIVTMTKRINGGTIGLEDRKKHWAHAIEVLGGEAPEVVEESHGYSLIKRGSRGDQVAEVQEVLGLDADGIFGPGTEAAVKAWQAEHGLTADGIVGPKTMEKMLG
jgi:putative chitinase